MNKMILWLIFTFVFHIDNLPSGEHGGKMGIIVSILPTSWRSWSKTQDPVSLHGMICKSKELYEGKGFG